MEVKRGGIGRESPCDEVVIYLSYLRTSAFICGSLFSSCPFGLFIRVHSWLKEWRRQSCVPRKSTLVLFC